MHRDYDSGTIEAECLLNDFLLDGIFASIMVVHLFVCFIIIEWLFKSVDVFVILTHS